MIKGGFMAQKPEKFVVQKHVKARLILIGVNASHMKAKKSDCQRSRRFFE